MCRCGPATLSMWPARWRRANPSCGRTIVTCLPPRLTSVLRRGAFEGHLGDLSAECETRRMKKSLPEFKTEDDERNFWTQADSTKFVDWGSGKRRQLVHLKPTLKTISLRLPVSMIADLKVLANRRDVPYQSLLKVFLAERLAQERVRRPE